MLNKLLRKKNIEDILNVDNDKNKGLKKNLTLKDLISLGIAAIIGAGIFSTIGNAAYYGGPAVSLLFVFTAIACGFSALCYAEFASKYPLSGSAYTYAYVSLGEFVAWIIGWDLIMEYSIGNIAVAISWSDYFTNLLKGLGIYVPEWLSMDYYSAIKGYKEVTHILESGDNFSSLSETLKDSYWAWKNAPDIWGFKFIVDLPAFMIVVLITILVYIGIKESKIAGNIMVILKLSVILLVIIVGAFYVNPQNWTPFSPNGISGILKGVSAVFFAYIGFDAISTTAEECKNPQKDLPRAMIISLLICALLYVMITFILTGMTSYVNLQVGDPLAFVFKNAGLDWISGIISVSAVIAMASVLLVFQIGQPRIWMSMSRDGLLPPKFSSIHPRYKTPSFSTIVTGIIVGIPTLFMNLTEVTDLTSIGTLFAFSIVCAGVIFLDKKQNSNTINNKAFKIYYINSRYFLIPLILIVLLILFNYTDYYEKVKDVFDFSKNSFITNIPTIIFFVVFVIIVFFAVVKEWSLIPVLGLLTNLYLLSELGVTNWLRFLIWLLIGLLIYFLYSRKNSCLNKSHEKI